ncbi:MAG: DUF6776 family protein [Steroidobacteraceae bacterium]
MDIPGKLVVRTYAPARRLTMLTMLVLLVALALYLAFESGRKKAGFDGIQAAQERIVLNDHIAQLEASAREARIQLAAADAAQVAQVRERSEVARNIGELQAELGRAQQDLEFYRAIANPQAPGAKSVPVRVQQFHVLVTDAATRVYTLRLALNRPIRPEESTAGVLVLTVDGERAGAAASLDLAALTGGKVRQLDYSFRYYANIEQAISLPADFKPERVSIEIRPARKGVAPYRQIFVWNPDAS